MKVYTYEKPATFGLLLMYIISGIFKIIPSKSKDFDIKRTSEFFRKFMNVNFSFVSILILMVGFFELATTGMVMYDLFYDTKTHGRLSKMSKMSIKSLIIFTVIVTLMFYTYPFKLRPFLSNLSTICALFFVLMIIERNTIQFHSNVKNETIQRVEQIMKKAKDLPTLGPAMTQGPTSK